MNKRVNIGTVWVLIALVLVLGDCRKKIIPQSDDYAEYAWTVLESGNLDAAKTQFQNALEADPTYADGYNGLGWLFIDLEEPDSAVYWFTQGLAFAPSGSTAYNEMLAGRAFAYHNLSNYPNAITDGQQLYTLDQNWIFSRDTSLNIADIQLLIAVCYYSQGDFVHALQWIKTLRPNFSADPNTAQGQARMASEIEKLQQIYG